MKQSNKYLFKGEPKNGKSIAAASFPKPYIFDLDKRIRSIAAFYPDKDFDYGWFNNFISVDKQLDLFLLRCEYRTLIFDSVTSFAEILINTMINDRPKNPRTTRGGVRMTEIEDFGGEQRGFNAAFDKLFMIQEKYDVNIIVTAHVIEVEKSIKPGVTIKSRSLLTAGKKVAAFLPVHFDEAYHFQVDVPLDGGNPIFECLTKHVGDDWASTTYNIPNKIDFTNKSFYDELQRLRKETNERLSNSTSNDEIGVGDQKTGGQGIEFSDSSDREKQEIGDDSVNDSKTF